MIARILSSTFLRLTRRQWIVGSVVFGIYFAVVTLANLQISNPVLTFPNAGIALGALFLAGVELWPFVYTASFLGLLLGGYPLPFLLIIPVAQALQAGLGAYLLQRGRLDPLFRRIRDMLLLVGVILFISLIVPVASTFAQYVYWATTGMQFHLLAFHYRYTSMLFSLLIISPFLMRWFTKPHFNRTWLEIAEIIGVFILLSAFDIMVFLQHRPTFFGIGTVYLLLIPLFWIALRLRPRFITLAFVITAGFAIDGLIMGKNPIGYLAFNEALYQLEAFLITLTSMFYIIVSVEEDRRVNSNLMKGQLATLENAVARITSESNAKNNFIAMLAHELRNPLAPVVSAIDLLRLTGERTKEDIETLDMMEDRMQTVKRLLDDLLDISRIEEGKIALNREPVDLRRTIDRAILSTEHYFRERHQAFTYKEYPEPLVVSGDPVRLEQIFSNLLTNASRYSDSGERITVSLSKEDGFARVTVRDTGIGIEESMMDKIFLPFHQVEHGSRPKRGLGIGLALVRNFVLLHEGTIRVESAGLGRGSAFTVEFPLLEGTSESVSEQSS